jgi:hypothetical protein
MPRKIAFIGAGSFGFTRGLVRDILTFPAFSDATIALMDVNPERLAYIKRAVDRIVTEGNYPATVVATMDRKEALTGADGVLCTILAGELNVWQHDILIPKKYGVDTNVGDTRGPSGIFRYLRTINPMLEIAADIDRYCPDAVFLNYTNPMAMLCRTIQGKYPKMPPPDFATPCREPPPCSPSGRAPRRASTSTPARASTIRRSTQSFWSTARTRIPRSKRRSSKTRRFIKKKSSATRCSWLSATT